MNRDRIEKLKEIVPPDEQDELEVLCEAYDNTLQAYQSDPDKSADKLKSNRAAKQALAELVETLENKYLTGAKQFRSRMAALRYLQENGWKIEKTKLFDDSKAGLLQVNADKSVDEVHILAYAAANLEKVKSTGVDDKAGELSESKLKAETGYRELQQEKLRFEIAKEKGQYIHRSKWLTELVSKLSAAKSVPLRIVRNRAPDLIAAVGGDLRKETMFIELFSGLIEDGYNELAAVPELQFVVQGNISNEQG